MMKYKTQLKVARKAFAEMQFRHQEHINYDFTLLNLTAMISHHTAKKVSAKAVGQVLYELGFAEKWRADDYIYYDISVPQPF